MLLRLTIQGMSILVLLWSVVRMIDAPLLWPYAAVLLVEAFWLAVSIFRMPRRMDGRLSGVLASAVVAVYPVLIAWLVPGPYVEPMWRFVVSYTVQLVALVLEVWALFTLRSALTQLPEAHRVVQSGPYRYVRHPLYVAYSLAFFGSCIGVMRLKLWLLFAGFLLLQWLRARAEERVLLATLPEYRSYAARVGRFIPRWKLERSSWEARVDDGKSAV